MANGALVFSFDVELAWGVRDRNLNSPRFEGGLRRVRDVVSRLLELFTQYEISATWAMVGHLMIQSDDCRDGHYAYRLPAPRPDWYDSIPAVHGDGAEDYYAPDIVQSVLDCPVHQELGSHTFSHVLANDGRCTAELFEAELAECQQLAKRWNRNLVSVVFPRNIIRHLTAVRATGYRCYRGPRKEWYWFGHPVEVYSRRWLRHLIWPLRYLDERFCVCPPLPSARRQNGLWEIPLSMFFPGMGGGSRFLDPEYQRRRALRGMNRAAERGRIFSLYTHPHNLLAQSDRVLYAFEQICRKASSLRDDGKLAILTMEQIADELDGGRNLHWLES